MKLGAYDYLFKPLELSQLRQVIDRALAISRLMHVPALMAEVEPADERADAIIGRCPAMQEVYKAIGRVAPQDVTVLITGENTGPGAAASTNPFAPKLPFGRPQQKKQDDQK